MLQWHFIWWSRVFESNRVVIWSALNKEQKFWNAVPWYRQPAIRDASTNLLCRPIIPILCTLPLWDLLTVSSPSRRLLMVYEAYHQHQGDGTACYQSVLIHFIWSPGARFSERRKSNLGLRFIFENSIRKHNNSQFVKVLNKTKLRNHCKLCAS